MALVKNNAERNDTTFSADKAIMSFWEKDITETKCTLDMRFFLHFLTSNRPISVIQSIVFFNVIVPDRGAWRGAFPSVMVSKGPWLNSYNFIQVWRLLLYKKPIYIHSMRIFLVIMAFWMKWMFITIWNIFKKMHHLFLNKGENSIPTWKTIVPHFMEFVAMWGFPQKHGWFIWEDPIVRNGWLGVARLRKPWKTMKLIQEIGIFPWNQASLG